MYLARSIWELGQLATAAELYVVFHGTRTVFAPALETHGWSPDHCPVRREDLERLHALSARAASRLTAEPSLFERNLAKYRREPAALFHFTTRVETALLYASLPGGETIRDLRVRCRTLVGAPPGWYTAAELAEVRRLAARYATDDQPGQRTVYAVRLHRAFVTDELAQEWEDGEAWRAFVPNMEVVVCRAVPASAILARWVSRFSFARGTLL